MDEAERKFILDYGTALRAHPEWKRMLDAQMSATMMAALRQYPFSYLPKETLVKWIEALS